MSEQADKPDIGWATGAMTQVAQDSHRKRDADEISRLEELLSKRKAKVADAERKLAAARDRAKGRKR